MIFFFSLPIKLLSYRGVIEIVATQKTNKTRSINL